MTGTEIERITDQGEVLLARDLRNAQTDSWTDVLEQVGQLAQRIANTAFVPESFRGNVASVAATILYGREVGLGPMQSLTTLHNIKGRVGMYAEAMRAMVLAAGHDIVYEELSSARVTVRGRRKGTEEWSSVTWTIDDARQAKLSGENWSKYPRAMLAARATAELSRLLFADAIHGLAAVEELDELQPVVEVGPAGALPSGGGQPAAGTKVQRRARKATPAAPTVPEPVRPAPPLPDAPPPQPTAQGAAEPPLPPTSDPVPDDTVVDAEIVDEPPVERPRQEMVSPQQRAMIMVKFAEVGVEDRTERLYVTGCLAGRRVESANHLTKGEASAVIDALASVHGRDELEQLLTITGEPR